MAPITRPRHTEANTRFNAILSVAQRAWIDRAGQRQRPRVGATHILRDALTLYQDIVRILAPNNKVIPPLLEIITTVRAALVAYLAQPRAAMQAADVAATDPARVAADAEEDCVALPDR